MNRFLHIDILACFIKKLHIQTCYSICKLNKVHVVHHNELDRVTLV